MVSFPGCKINIGLLVNPQRADGYHDLETIFYPIPWQDVLEIIPSKNKETNMFVYGMDVPGKEDDNICVKAYNLLKKEFPNMPACDIHLQKNIPIGAGLGGGSSNASATLLSLIQMFDLKISFKKLSKLALTLGSDCPFFLHNKPMHATGRGEELIPIELDLSMYQILLVNPQLHISTAQAFKDLREQIVVKGFYEKEIKKPIKSWQKNIINHFEEGIFIKHPEIKDLKEFLYAKGASYASMSGTGSTVYGIFQEKIDITDKLPEGYLYHWV